MLIDFKIENYRSFKELDTFTARATAIKELSENVYDSGNLKLLKTCVFYGKNGSGKSNFFQSLHIMKKAILEGMTDNIMDHIVFNKFRLDTVSVNLPTIFEITLLIEETIYRYGFGINKGKVEKEWLFKKLKRETQMFFRDETIKKVEDRYIINKSYKLKLINQMKDITKDTSLFLNTLNLFKDEVSNSIINWFKKLNVISNLADYKNFTMKNILENKKFKEETKKFLGVADIGIEDVEITTNEIDFDFEKMPNQLKNQIINKLKKSKLKKSKLNTDKLNVTSQEIKIFFKHKKYNEKGEFLELEDFPLDIESQGTKKLFSLAGPILDSLLNGKVLFIDEFDTKIHPFIMKFIIDLFNSEIKNPNNAQLFVNTHSPYLLNRKLFRRDQVWFAEKDEYGKTEIFSLGEFGIRNDRDYRKDYLLGLYGAIPKLDEDNFFINFEDDKEV